MELQELALRVALALALGFVIGLERGWKERDEEEGARTAGIRTFSLIGLLGGVFGLLSRDGNVLLLAAGFATLGATLGMFMWREGQRHDDFSATSLVAALLTFMLGALAVMGDMTVAAGAGVATVALLAYKTELHGFLSRITWTELRSGLLLGAMTFIALPLLPDRAIDPWGALNPHDLWLMTILVAAVSFAGYAAVKIAGPEKGLLLAAALGGLFASTAVTLSLARLAPGNEARVRLLAGGILAAGCVMMVRVLVVAGIINLPLAILLAPALLAAAMAQGISAMVLVGRDRRGSAGEAPELAFKNPFLLSEVLRFAAVLTAVFLAATFAQRYFGNQGLFVVAALSGLADVDAMTLSAAGMPGATVAAALAILIAVGVNTIAKSVYAWYAGGTRLGIILLVQNIITVGVAVLVMSLLSSWNIPNV